MDKTGRIEQRISQRIKDLGRTARDVSIGAGLGADYVRDLLAGRKKSMRVDAMSAVARELGVTVAWLQGDDSAMPAPENHPEPGRDVPVHGTAAGAFNGAIKFTGDHPIDWMRRPPGLAGARDAYALYVKGDSMEPLYRSGEPVFVHPHRPVRPGDRVVIQVRTHEGADTEVWVKEFVRMKDGDYVVRQFNPPQEIVFKRASVIEIHRILTPAELLDL